MPSPTPNPLYAIRQSAPGEFQMAKFSMPDFNVEAVYNLRAKGHSYTCDCPASARAVKTKPCKHQRMMPFMMGAVNSDRFYEPESGRWISALPVELTKEGYNGAAPVADPNSVEHPVQTVTEPPAATPTQPQTQAQPVAATAQAGPTLKRRI